MSRTKQASDPGVGSVPIAIVGLSCRFAGDASTPSKFWDLLKSGRDGFSESTGRYTAKAFYDPTQGSGRQNAIPSMGGNFLQQNPFAFDAGFFNITASEAAAMDPKQRIVLEVAFEALENAGFPLQRIASSQTACFIGSTNSDYRDGLAQDFPHFTKYHFLGNSDEILSNRVSHFFDLRGPSATVQTACSSSHVATHFACSSLRSGEADMALAGGVNLILAPHGSMHLNNLGFLGPTGRSHTFDEQGAGYGRGEGCGIIVLKRLDNALASGDTIRAIIRASGVNSDGWTQGITMPSGDAQAALIERVYESNGLGFECTQFVEAHGTGTKAGDPVEVAAIQRTIARVGLPNAQRRTVFIGSVKPNIGHLEAAAGVAAIIKSVLALEHGIIPPNIHLSKLNPDLPLDAWNMTIPTSATHWPNCPKRRVSINGFGMGGTNAHLVLEAYNQSPSPNFKDRVETAPAHADSTKQRLFVFSSHDQAGFKRIGKKLIEYVDSLGPSAMNGKYLGDLAYTLGLARSGLTWKACCFAKDAVELRTQLETRLGEDTARTSSNRPLRVGFVFTGQGAQWARMGVELMGRRVFSASVKESALLLKGLGCDWDPVAELLKAPNVSRLSAPEVSQPICTVLQIALVDELRSWGITPAKVVGHSSGEIAAAYSIGALSRRDALAVAYFRGQVIAAATFRQGGMLAVGCSPDAVQVWLTKLKFEDVTVACVNSPSSVTLSGDKDALEALKSALEQDGTFARQLKVEVAYHSPHVAPVCRDYADKIDDIEPLNEPFPSSGTMISSVTASEIDFELLGPLYWVRNLRSPVLFANALHALLSPTDEPLDKHGINLLIEIGPHGALGGPIEQILHHYEIHNVSYTSMLTRGEDAPSNLLGLAATLVCHGATIDASKVNDDIQCKLLTDLPPYAWNHTQHFDALSRIYQENIYQESFVQSLIGAKMPCVDVSEHVWRNYIHLGNEPWLRDHVIGSMILMPGAGMVCMVLEALKQLINSGKAARAFKFRDISFLSAMMISENSPTETLVRLYPQVLSTAGSALSPWWEFTVSSCTSKSQIRTNCRGLVSILYTDNRSIQREFEDASVDVAKLADYQNMASEVSEFCSKEEFYKACARSGLNFGGTFQGVASCKSSPGKAVYEVEITDLGKSAGKGLADRPSTIHPATLDSCLLGIQATLRSDGSSDLGADKTFLPVGIGELEILADIPVAVGYRMPGLCRSKQHRFNDISADCTLFDEDLTKALVSITDFRVSEVELDEADSAQTDCMQLDSADIAFELHWNFVMNDVRPEEVPMMLTEPPIDSTKTLTDLTCLIFHQRPAMAVLEIVSSQNDLTTAIAVAIPENLILPSQFYFGVGLGETEFVDFENPSRGQLLNLKATEASLHHHNIMVELIIIPEPANNAAGKDLGDILDRALSIAKLGTAVLVSSSAAKKSITSAVCRTKQLEPFWEIPTGTSQTTLYFFRGQRQQDIHALANNVCPRKEFVIIEPAGLSAEAYMESQKLQNFVEDLGYDLSVIRDIRTIKSESVSGKACICLQELEHSILALLSPSQFQAVQNLLCSCERLIWVTLGEDPSFGIIDGLARTVNHEIASCKIQTLHLSGAGMRYTALLIQRILCSHLGDNEFRERKGLLQIPRFYRGLKESRHIRDHLYNSTQVVGLCAQNPDETAPILRLTIEKPGLLDTLHFLVNTDWQQPLRGDDVEIQTKAVGLNFRDVMAAMGLVPVKGFGQEASGIVLRVGHNVTEFKPGDRVTTFSPGSCATYFRCDYRVTKRIPDSLSFEEAAAIPVVFTTAYYALTRVAKLHPGQSVLIHAAAGGVGQAAVQIAQHLGLAIFATVGTDAKKQLIMDKYGIAESSIFNSRDDSFVMGIKRKTQGRGVDMILNSLSGELLRVSLECLAMFGTFVEIGLRDITDNTRLDMRSFGKGISFSFLDMASLVLHKPAEVGEALTECFNLLSREVVRAPYPISSYPVSQAEDAFRLMQQGKHHGKLVLSFTGDNQKVSVFCAAKDSLKLNPDVTYLFIGGLGGLGRSLAMEFVSSGARHFAFISRSGHSKSEAKVVIEQLQKAGAHVRVLRGDIADKASFLAAIEDCSKHLPPIAGVIQMAMVLKDVVFEKMSYEDWNAGLAPKVQGTWNIHEYFNHDRPLDFMILCSSISGIWGNPGQAQYAAGNTYLDSLAHFRRSQGLKAVSVNLGIIRNIGVIAEQGSKGLSNLETALGISAPVFHALMKSLINGQLGAGSCHSGYECSPQVVTGLGTADNFALAASKVPRYFENPQFGSLTVPVKYQRLEKTTDQAQVTLSSRLLEAVDKSHANAIITDGLCGKLADILRIPLTEVDSSRPMYHYGVDSLVALEVRNWITREMRANMALLEILAAVPIEKFAEQVARKSKLLAEISW